jgi:hypothetical protein
MSTADLPRPLIALRYAEAAEAYLRSLPLEHFMEATGQSTQRKITLEASISCKPAGRRFRYSMNCWSSTPVAGSDSRSKSCRTTW